VIEVADSMMTAMRVHATRGNGGMAPNSPVQKSAVSQRDETVTLRNRPADSFLSSPKYSLFDASITVHLIVIDTTKLNTELFNGVTELRTLIRRCWPLTDSL
jgi:PBP1b-binding outer membrane lipoprotein LpoB